jgi:hypothetical protein
MSLLSAKLISSSTHLPAPAFAAPCGPCDAGHTRAPQPGSAPAPRVRVGPVRSSNRAVEAACRSPLPKGEVGRELSG